MTPDIQKILDDNLGSSTPSSGGVTDRNVELQKAQKEIARLRNSKQESKPAPKEDGFFTSVGKAIVKPLAKVAVQVENIKQGALKTATGAFKQLTGDQEGASADYSRANEELSKSREVPWLGKVEPVTTFEQSAGQQAKNIASTGLEIASTIAGGSGAIGLGKTTLKGVAWQGAKQVGKEGAISGAMSFSGQEIQEKDATLGSVLKAAAQGFGVGGLFGGALGAVGGATGKIGKEIGKEVRQATSLPGQKLITSADELVDKADEILSKPGGSEILYGKAKDSGAELTIRDRWAGISPDIKKRIQGKGEKLKSYFNVAHARNLDDRIPTPLEFATKQVDRAEEALNNVLSDTGSSLGKFREKIKGYRIAIPEIEKVAGDFDNELFRLNLEVKNNAIYQVKGKAQKIGSGEKNLLQTLRDNLLTLKQNPTVEGIIENRMIFDDRINFAKQSRDVSSILDPISRRIRTSLAELNRKTVGKLESKTIDEYSLLREALKELEGYTQKRSGAEFLLKRVLSERGGQPREILNVINKYTGIDLMDDATMAQIATDLIGNSRQKGLFRQEIEKAGLDVAAFLSGNKLGAVQALLKSGKNLVVDTEKQFMRAAGGVSKPFNSPTVGN